MNVVIYARTARADDEDKLDEQVRRCQEYAEAKGYAVVQVYRDLGQSGVTADRPGLRHMMADLAQPGMQVKRVLVTDVARLARAVDVFTELMSAFLRRDIVIERLDEGAEGAEAAVVAKVQQLVAEYERRAIQARMKATRKRPS